jgi:small subunit ribosomal protein S1
VEGLVHVSEASKEKIKTPVGLFKVGDTITAKVINITKKERRIGLSVRRARKDEEQTLIKEYMSGSKEASSNLGDLLREEMENKNKFSLDSAES